MKNPIPKSGFFATYELEEIQAMIENLPKTHRPSLHMVMMLTLNACNKIVEEQLVETTS